MLNNSLLNPLNYAFVGSYPVSNGKDLILPANAELRHTMLIRWTINHLSKDTNFDSLGSGLLISEIEIQGFGVIESQTFDILPSDFKTKRVQLIDLDLEVPQKLTFRPQSKAVLNSVLEFYAYTGKDEPVYQTFHSEYMPSNNPQPVDSNQLAAAIAQAFNQQSQAATAHGTVDRIYSALPWSGDESQHQALGNDDSRLKLEAFNQGSERVYISHGKPTGKPFESYTDFIDPQGRYYSSPEDRTLPLVLYTAAGTSASQLSISEFFAYRSDEIPTL